MYKKDEVIIDYEPFIYEDGEQYYFRITSRGETQPYHYIRAYKLVKSIVNSSRGFLFWKKTVTKEVDEYKLLGELNYNLEGWDGFVGDVTDEEKKKILRNTKIKNIVK